MGADLDIQEILNSRSEISEKILYNLKSWDGETESGINILDLNQENLYKLKEIDKILSDCDYDTDYDKEYENKLHSIIDEQKKLMQALKSRQDNLKDYIKQIGQKERVISNYIKKENEPIFINKQLY